MQPVLRALSFHAFLRIPGRLPALVGIPLIVLGCVYLFFGKRLFRLLIAAVGAAIGFELGRILGLHFHLNPLWLEIPGAVVVGGVFWPLWQVAVFVVGGGGGALLGAQALQAANGGDTMSFLLGAAAGFVLGGVFSVLLMKLMAVVITAGLGAAMVFLGALALGRHLALVRTLTHLPLVSAAILAILAIAGIVAQAGQPDAEVANKRKVAEAEAKAKAAAEAEARERYQRYRHGG